MRPWLCRLWLAALAGVGCAGTEGTLVVVHEAAAGAGSGGGGGQSGVGMPYVPPADVSWQAKLTGAVDVDEEVELFYLDADLQDPDDLSRLRAEGRHYLCYLSAGTLEDFRDDFAEFPAQVIGKTHPAFPEERWLDVRAPAVRELMARRIERLGDQGCDGIPPSSLAVHTADTGFALSLNDALDYARWLAERIHAAGMSAGLTGPAELTEALWPTFDFALAIACIEGTQCAEFAAFEQAQKPVLHLELGDASSAADICKSAELLGFDPLISSPSFNGQTLRCQDIL